MDWTTPLTQLALDDLPTVGAKAARLGELARAGLPVPAGFVVPAEILAEAAQDGGVGFGKPAAERGAAPSLSEPLASAILRESTRQFGEQDIPLVVRSSALAEDGAEHSFAGLHSTYYYVFRRDLVATVARCWRSLFQGEATAYRNAKGLTDVGGMAVIVQRMVAADQAGVSFFEEPTGRYPQHTLIEATWGLGAALVDGRVTPDQYYVDRNQRVTHRRTARKRLRVAGDLEVRDAPRLEPVPLALQNEPVLSDAQAAEIARATATASACFKAPQDVEWALAGGHLAVLQSRDITTPSAEEPAPRGKWVLFKPLAENFTGPLTPLTASLFQQVLPPLGRFIQGRYYLRFFWARWLLPLRLPERRLADLVLLHGAPPRLRDLSWWRLPLSLILLGLSYLASGAFWHRSGRLRRTSLDQLPAWYDELRQRRLPPVTLLREIIWGRGPFVPLWRRPFLLNLSSGRYFLLLGALRSFLRTFAPGLPAGTLEDLCRGRDDMLSRQLIDATLELAELAREHAEIATALNGSVATRRDLLDQLPEAHPFMRALTGFLDHYGHRGAKEIELAAPRWREDPLAVLAMVQSQLQQPPDGKAYDRHRIRLAAADRLHQSLPKVWQRRIADGLIARIRNHLTLRENTRHYTAMALGLVRERLQEIEAELLRRGALRCADDIFFLTTRELDDLVRSRLDWRTVEPRLLARRQRYRLEAKRQAPLHWNLSEDGMNRTEERWLLGQCASPGFAEGRARLVFDPSMDNDLAPGDILIAPYTDPGWTPLFPRAAAIVVEVGSYLSHAGTLAREFGVPCLVDVNHCTERIRDGQPLRVCATDGRVELLES